MYDYVEVEIWEFEDYIELHYPCGCIEQLEFEEFYEMIEDGEIDVLEDDCEDCEFYDECNCFEDDEDFIDEELDYMLTDIADEIQKCLALGDYEGVATLSVAYANLFELI